MIYWAALIIVSVSIRLLLISFKSPYVSAERGSGFSSTSSSSDSISNIKSIYKKLAKNEPKKTDNEVYNEEKLKRKSIDELKEIAKLRRIKNRSKLKKEGLINIILKSESNYAEHNYMRHFNINTNVDNNNNTNDDDNTYDGKIRDKTSDIRYLVDWVIQ